jgi:[ribosomal protein S5]-alanine N-acetyltransferase
MPAVSSSGFTVRALHRRNLANLDRRDAGLAYPYVILDRFEIVGVLTLREIRDGQADLTFRVDIEARDRGAATEAVAQICLIARDAIGLYRLVSATHLTNGAAQRVLEKNRFELIGRSGRRQDHLLFQRLLHAPVATRMHTPGPDADSDSR